MAESDATYAARADAVRTQKALRAVHDTSARLKACVVASDKANPSAAIIEGMKIAFSSVASVMLLHQHPGRLAEAAERRRIKKRMMDVAVNKVIDAARIDHTDPLPETPRLPVVLIGDWLKKHGAGGAFPLQRFIKHLAKRCIVIVCDEFRTTRRCGDCGADTKHPLQSDHKTEFRGTLQCADETKTCGSRGRFKNRDVAAACNISSRFLCGFYVGGSLGAVVGGVVFFNIYIFIFMYLFIYLLIFYFILFFLYTDITPATVSQRQQAVSRGTDRQTRWPTGSRSSTR
jgi:hypothetical protein